MKVSGIIPPIGTPLTNAERVDEKALRRLVRYLLQSGVHGIFANGTMGAFALLTDVEQCRAIEIVADEVDHRVPVMAGISDTGTKRAITKARQIERLGVDYITALAPFYFLLTQESATRFFREVAQAIQKPLFLYNNPFLVSIDLSVNTVLALSEEPNIVGMKDTSQDANRWAQIITALRGRSQFSFLVGTELLIPIGLQLGADGVVGGLHNVAPKLAVDLYQAAIDGDLERVRELNNSLHNLFKIFEFGEVWGGFEAALQYLRLADKATASPYAQISSTERLKVEDLLREYGITPVLS